MREFWPCEARRVTTEYPFFELRDRLPRPNLDEHEAARCGAFVRTWRGTVQPFSPDLDRNELVALIADLYDDVDAVSVSAGSLRHDAARCGRAHTLDPDLVPRRAVNDIFEIELAYCVPPARPVVRSLRPFLTVRQYPDMPHPIAPLSSLCVSYPPTDAWDLDRDGALLYLDWTAVYLAKHTLWLEARERKGRGRAKWPGAGIGPAYDPHEELKSSATASCSCGSGERYASCHRTVDKRNAELKRRGLTVERPVFAPPAGR